MTRNPAIRNRDFSICLAVLAAALCLGSAAAANWRGECDEREPFKTAEFAPADVTFMIQVRGAAGLRQALADRPIASWLNELVDTSLLDSVWTGLAEQTGYDRGRLFDRVLGGRFTVFVRADDAESEWALVTETHPFRIRKIFEHLDPVVIGPTSGLTLHEIPEHELLLARDERFIVVGPKMRRDLFDDVVQRVGQSTESKDGSLASSREMRRAREIGGGRIEVFARHGGLIGGWSALTATFDDDRVTLNQIARFENSPFAGEITGLEIEPSLVRAFQSHSLLALAMPTDVGDGPFMAFVESQLGEPILSTPLRRNVGDLQVISVGEVEGRLEPNQVDMLVPTFAVCLELRDPTTAGEQLDEHMMRIVRSIEAKSQGKLLIPMDPLGDRVAGVPRHVDIAGAGDWFVGGFPVLRNVSLNWTIAPGPGEAAYLVVATHPDQLQSAVTSLGEAALHGDARRKVSHVGAMNGQRLGQHLFSYSEEAEKLAGAEAAAEFQHSLKMLAHFCAGIETAHWVVTRPCQTEMRLEASIQLAPSPSAAGSLNLDLRSNKDCPRPSSPGCQDAR